MMGEENKDIQFVKKFTSQSNVDELLGEIRYLKSINNINDSLIQTFKEIKSINECRVNIMNSELEILRTTVSILENQLERERSKVFVIRSPFKFLKRLWG